ncbi:MAG: ribonuclease HII [Rhizobacter sp.]|nr:ribonuclease HII [Burkholderiales bacterium]
MDAWLCGIDEAGRGPLAGPVFAAAVVLGANGRSIVGLDDSKKLSATRRDALAVLIKTQAHAWAIASATAVEVDQLNILQATMLAMFRAVEQLPEANASLTRQVVIDGTQIPRSLGPWALLRNITIIAQPRADADVQEVSAASILAKTARDAYMLDVHARFPHYGFAAHKGYGTAVHMKALTEHGPCDEHRLSFAPVAQWKLI